jgi:hypothetical protein
MSEKPTVVVSINEHDEQAYVSGTDYDDVLRKIDVLREMALEGKAKQTGQARDVEKLMTFRKRTKLAVHTLTEIK